MLKRVVLVKNLLPYFVFEMGGTRYVVQTVNNRLSLDCVTVSARADFDCFAPEIYLDLTPNTLFAVHIPLS